MAVTTLSRWKLVALLVLALSTRKRVTVMEVVFETSRPVAVLRSV